MIRPTPEKSAGTILIVGASRGLGYAMACEFIRKDWTVVATVRPSDGRTHLHDLAKNTAGRVTVETVDICDPEQIAALRARLSGRVFEILFVNAGTGNTNPQDTIAQVSTEDFIRVMVTNALGPMRTIEALQDLVRADGLIGVMSSGQGSITNNTTGGFEVYRGSKSALNQYMRSYAARHAKESRALLLMAPGWIRTALGGPNAPLTMEEAIPDVVKVLLEKQGRPGLEYLDRMGKTVAW